MIFVSTSTLTLTCLTGSVAFLNLNLNLNLPPKNLPYRNFPPSSEISSEKSLSLRS